MLEKYHSIIVKNLSRKKSSVYTEKHHIIPKSIFKYKSAQESLNRYSIEDIKKGNIVHLKAKDHLECHLLLPLIFKEVDKNCFFKMLHAANIMNNRGIKKENNYAMLKEDYSKMMTDKLKGKTSRAKGCKWTQEQKRRKSENSTVKGKTYEEIYGYEKAIKLKEIRRNRLLGTKQSKEAKDKISKIIRGPEWRKKISESKKGTKLSEGHKLKLKEHFSNPYLNPNINPTLYLFENIKTKEQVVARCYDMWKKYNLTTLHRLVRGTAKKCKNWIIKEKINAIQKI